MNIELKEIEIEWPPSIGVFQLKNFILSKLIPYGEPIRWAITSLTNCSEKTNQKILIEAVFIINDDISNYIDTGFD